MIDPTDADIGRKVVYRPNKQHSLGGFKSPDEYAEQEGTFMGFYQGFPLILLNGEQCNVIIPKHKLFWKENQDADA